MSDDRLTTRSFKEILKDYEYDPSVFNEEPDRIRRIKRVIMLELDPVDRILILMYADCGSLRKLGARLGCSHVTINKEIRRIRAEIVKRIQNGKD